MRTLYTLILSIVLITTISCNSINPDPIKGAKQLNEDLTELANSNDLQGLHTKLSEYWNAYPEELHSSLFRSLQWELLSNNSVVRMMADSDFNKYPMCGKYLQMIQEFAFADAMSALENMSYATHEEKNNLNLGPAEKGILLASLLANYSKTNDKDSAYDVIETAYNKLKSQTELYKIIFFSSFIKFIKHSGQPGIQAFELMQDLKSPTYTEFQRLALENRLEY